MCDVRIEVGGGAGFALGAIVAISLGMYDGAAALFGISLIFVFFFVMGHVPKTPIAILLTVAAFIFGWFFLVYSLCPSTYTGIASHITDWLDNIIGGTRDAIFGFFGGLWDGFTAWLARWGLIILVVFVGLISFYIAMVYLSNRRQL